jgi:5-methylcytosine-specific restriction endonuclease McrA
MLKENYTPLTLWPLPLWHWQDVVRGLYLGSLSPVINGPVRLNSPSQQLQLPLVARVCRMGPEVYGYEERKLSVRLSLENLFLRDLGYCVYCREQLSVRRSTTGRWATVDHVVPRSRGGGNSWKNVVLACQGCNVRKDNKTPEEAGMPLPLRPWSPTPEELLKLRLARGRLAHEAWRDFLTLPQNLPRVEEAINALLVQAAF